MDLDNNGYPDLLVGAYDSGHAVHISSAPVVQMTASINFVRQQIELNDLHCILSDGTEVPCFKVEATLKYTGVGVPNRIDFDLKYNLDSKKEKQKRMFLQRDEGKSTMTRTISMTKDREFPHRFTVYLLGSEIIDKLTSLEIQMKYSFSDISKSDSSLTPVLAHGDHIVRGSLSIQKNCGSDRICIPNLSVQTKK